MGHRAGRYLEICPDCGQYMAKNIWRCSSCGWSLYDPNLDEFAEDSGSEGWVSLDPEYDIDPLQQGDHP